MLKKTVISAFFVGLVITLTPIHAHTDVGPACFYNSTNYRVYYSIVWAQGGILNFVLEPGGRYQVNGADNNPGTYYCSDFQPLGGGCPNQRPLNINNC